MPICGRDIVRQDFGTMGWKRTGRSGESGRREAKCTKVTREMSAFTQTRRRAGVASQGEREKRRRVRGGRLSSMQREDRGSLLRLERGREIY